MGIHICITILGSLYFITNYIVSFKIIVARRVIINISRTNCGTILVQYITREGDEGKNPPGSGRRSTLEAHANSGNNNILAQESSPFFQQATEQLNH